MGNTLRMWELPTNTPPPADPNATVVVDADYSALAVDEAARAKHEAELKANGVIESSQNLAQLIEGFEKIKMDKYFPVPFSDISKIKRLEIDLREDPSADMKSYLERWQPAVDVIEYEILRERVKQMLFYIARVKFPNF